MRERAREREKEREREREREGGGARDLLLAEIGERGVPHLRRVKELVKEKLLVLSMRGVVKPLGVAHEHNQLRRRIGGHVHARVRLDHVPLARNWRGCNAHRPVPPPAQRSFTCHCRRVGVKGARVRYIDVYTMLEWEWQPNATSDTMKESLKISLSLPREEARNRGEEGGGG